MIPIDLYYLRQWMAIATSIGDPVCVDQLMVWERLGPDPLVVQQQRPRWGDSLSGDAIEKRCSTGERGTQKLPLGPGVEVHNRAPAAWVTRVGRNLHRGNRES